MSGAWGVAEGVSITSDTASATLNYWETVRLNMRNTACAPARLRRRGKLALQQGSINFKNHLVVWLIHKMLLYYI